MAMKPYPVRVKLAGLCRAHGWRLTSFRKRRDGMYIIQIAWDPMYAPKQSERTVEFISPLDKAYATVNAYVTSASGVYFMGKP